MTRITPIELLEIVAVALGDLRDEEVFVGGAITGLLLTDPAAPPTSSTKDVDIIVSVTTQTDFLGSLAERMRAQGFGEDTEEDAPICRWRLREADIKVDLMPTEPGILGFTNRWIAESFLHAKPYRLPGGVEIRVVTGPYFLATKLEAFGSRGGGDYMASKDMEDLIAVLHGREELVEELSNASAGVREYLRDQARKLLMTREFVAALAGHLPGEDIARVPQRLRRMIEIQ
jgi:predicted nucleotidyltransferase